MPVFKKMSSVMFLSFTCLLISAGFVYAQGGELEIEYPQVPGAQTPTTVKTTALPDYVKYVFNFGIGIAGLVAFGVLVLGGSKYLTSAGSPSVMGDAKDQIFAGLLGLVILLSSWLLLTTINPQLVILREPGKTPPPKPGQLPGVRLCFMDGGKEKCSISYTSDAASLGEFNNKGNNLYVKFTGNFGLVLHEDERFLGRCKVCTSGDCKAEISALGGNGASSMNVFRPGSSSSGEGVSLYEKVNFNENCPTCKRWPVSGGYTDEQLPALNQVGKSIKVDDNFEYLAILFEGQNYGGRCEVFRESDRDLASNPIGICNCGLFSFSNCGCFRSVIVLPAQW